MSYLFAAFLLWLAYVCFTGDGNCLTQVIGIVALAFALGLLL